MFYIIIYTYTPLFYVINVIRKIFYVHHFAKVIFFYRTMAEYHVNLRGFRFRFSCKHGQNVHKLAVLDSHSVCLLISFIQRVNQSALVMIALRRLDFDQS